MELSPRSVANTTFKTVKKGYDPQDVRAYLESVAKAIENLQSHATTMESRARAALARLQEIAAQPAQPDPVEAPEPVSTFAAGAIEESATISRTLLLAQRTADLTVAEATAEAKRIIDSAEEDSRSLVDGAQEAANRMIEEAVLEARRSGEGQRIEVENEVQSLLARREFLIGDVDHLELHMGAQRDRLRSVASALTEIASSTAGGLGEIRRPLVSAVGSHDVSTGATPDGGVPAATDASTDEVSGPVFDALEESSALSALDASGHEADDLEPLSVPEPVTLTPIAEPELDPIWSDPVDPDDAVAATDAADVAAVERTPPFGQPIPMRFENFTGDVAQVPSPPSEAETAVGGDGPF